MEQKARVLVSNEVIDFVTDLDQVDQIEAGFELLGQYVTGFGFDAISYSAIPRSMQFAETVAPVFLASAGFSAGFLRHYEQASLWQNDFTIERTTNGHLSTLDWAQEARSGQLTDPQLEVIELARVDYGIANAITIPTQGDQHVVAGASITSSESNAVFNCLLAQRSQQVRFMVNHFHYFVFSSVSNRALFYQPVIDGLSPAERLILGFVVAGRPLKQCKEFTGVSPTRAGNILSALYRRLRVSNASELAYLIGHHQVLGMLDL